jgi:hypothetical protein
MRLHTVVVASTLAISCAAQSTPKQAQELAAYPLTMDHVTRQYQTLTELALQFAKDPVLKGRFQGWDKLPMDQQIGTFAASEKTLAMAKAHGLTPRDLVMTMRALQAVMTVFPSIEEGQGPNQDNKLEFEASSPDHVKFFRDHQPEIMKLALQFASTVKSSKK